LAEDTVTATIASQERRAISRGAGGTLIHVAGGIGVALLTGLLIELAFDPHGYWPLIFVAFVPMVVAQHRILPASLSGLAPGIGIACLFAHELSGGLADGGVAWYYQLLPVYVGLLIAGLAWRSRRFHERTGYRWFLISFPVAWVGVDFLRNLSGVDFLGGTWGSPAYALYAQYWFLQPLSVFGHFGLQLLVLVVNFAIARAAIALIDCRLDGDRASDHRKTTWKSLTVAVLLVVAWGGLSGIQLLIGLEEGAPVRVAAVQPNAVLDSEEEFRRDIAMTREAAERGAQLVVWREAGLKFNPLVEHTSRLKALAAETGATIAMGYRYKSEKGHHNEALVLTPEGTFHGPYGKTHPGRFAGDYSDTGGHFEVYETPIGPLATIICYDLDFTDTAREMARLGARIVAVPSADVPAIARSHYTHLVFRAIENRLAMVKADNTFDSVIIDPYGRMLELELNLWSVEQTKANGHGETPPALIVADVPPGPADSMYVRLGDWVGWLAVAAMISFFGVARWQTVRRHFPGPGDDANKYG
jgi:apolipoprotein N-acyltransferase